MIKTIGNGKVNLGLNCSVGENVSVIFKKDTIFSVGDYVTIGDGVKIIIEDGDVKLGDWSTVHANTLVLSKVGVEIGRHCWFGQNSILDGTGGLRIMDGVRVGMYSQIWTHVAAGEQIEGCKLFSARPTVIMNDAWLVGSCTVGSGITIGERAICMNGSNITKSVPAHTVALGAPATVREGLSFYRKVTPENKFSMMCDWVSEFSEISGFKFLIKDEKTIEIIGDKKILIHLYSNSFLSCIDDPQYVHFCIESKTYQKKYSIVEEQLIRFLSGNKARFYPLQNSLDGENN